MSSLLCHGIKGRNLAAPEPGVWSLEYQRHAVETRVGHYSAEEGLADISASHRGVSVDLRAERAEGVVEVHGREVAEADGGVEIGPDGVVALGGRHVVAGGEGVAAVDADPYPRFVIYLVDDGGELLEGIAESRALAGGVLDDGLDAVGDLEAAVNRVGDEGQALRRLDAFEVGAGVEVEHRDAETAATAHLVDENLARHGVFALVGVAEVDHERRVRQYRVGAVAIPEAFGYESVGHGVVERQTLEVRRIKQIARKSARAKAMGLSRRGRNIGLRRYMYAYEFHPRNY